MKTTTFLYRIISCLVCLLPLLTTAQNEGTDMEFVVEKRCNDFKLLPNVDTLHLPEAPLIDGLRLNPHTFKFFIDQCGLNLIDSATTSCGTILFRDSFIILTILDFQCTNRLTINLLRKGQSMFVKNYTVIQPPPFQMENSTQCMCLRGTSKFLLYDSIRLNFNLPLSKALLTKFANDTSNANVAPLSILNDTTKQCYSIVSTLVTSSYSNKTGRHKLNQPVDNNFLSMLTSDEIPVYAYLTFTLKFRRTNYCPNSPNAGTPSQTMLDRIAPKRIQKMKFTMQVRK